MRIICSCGRKLLVNDALAGKRIKCPSCGAAVLAREMVPATSPAGARPEPAAGKKKGGSVAAESRERRPPKKKKAPAKKSSLMIPLLLGGAALVVGAAVLVLAVVLSQPRQGGPPPQARAPGSAGPAAPPPPGAARPNPPPPAAQPPGAPAEAALPIRAEDLTKEYLTDPKAADKKFKGKLLVVDGIVHLNNIDHPLFSVELKGAMKDGSEFMLVVCSLRKDLEGKLNSSAVTDGARARLQGRCTGLDQVERVVLADCELVTGPNAAPPPDAGARSGGAQPEWKEFTSPEGGFAILFPGEPLREKEGNQYKFTVLVAGGQFSYMVTADQLARDALADGPKAVLAANQFGQQPGLPNGKITGKKEIALGKSPGVEWVEEWNDGRARETVARAYVVGDHLYQLVVVYPKGQKAQAQADKFFDSFKPR